MRRLNQQGDKNPFWKGGKPEFKCLQCGKIFHEYQNSRKRPKRKFCCYQCSRDFLKRRIMVKCEYCGKEFERSTYELERNKGKKIFCSRQHAARWASDNLIGEKHHNYGKKFSYEHRKKMGDSHRAEKAWNWKGGTKSLNQALRKQMDYRDWRKAVFERDDYTCQRCLIRSGFGETVYLEAHHILLFGDFSEERYETSNGATLCLDCHDWIHTNEYPNNIVSSVPSN